MGGSGIGKKIFSCSKTVFVIFAMNDIWTILGNYLAVKRYLNLFRPKTIFYLFFTKSGKRYLGKIRAVNRYWLTPPPPYYYVIASLLYCLNVFNYLVKLCKL